MKWWQKYEIQHHLLDKLLYFQPIPTLPPEITDAQVTSGVGTDEVLMTPTKLKTAITIHRSLLERL
jgi:hypothetical protein